MPEEQKSALGRSIGRKVGVEIEFGGLDTMAAAAVVRDQLGGVVDATSPHLATVRGTAIGDVKVELDWSWAHQSVDDGGVIDTTRDLIAAISNEVVPTEIVFPPIEGHRLGDLDALMRALSISGAKGTRAGLLQGFGLHLNPELWEADLAAEPLLRVLQAYLLRSTDLRAAIQVDLTRDVLPFVEPFDDAYLDLVLDLDYRPNLDALIDDYIRLNPTRNRELDMLPVFAHIDENRVHRQLADPKISKRPTFHWRLPNADLDMPSWSIIDEWRRWLSIEELALDTERLRHWVERWRKARPATWAGLA